MNWQVFALKREFVKRYSPHKVSPLPAEAWEDTGLNIVSTSYVASQQKAEKKFPGRILNVVMDAGVVRNLRPDGCKCGKKIGDNLKCPQHGVDDDDTPPTRKVKTYCPICGLNLRNDRCPAGCHNEIY